LRVMKDDAYGMPMPRAASTPRRPVHLSSTSKSELSRKVRSAPRERPGLANDDMMTIQEPPHLNGHFFPSGVVLPTRLSSVLAFSWP